MAQQQAAFHPGFLESSQIPRTGKRVAAKSLLPADSENLGRNSVALFVEYNSTIYAAHPDELVPADAVLERDQHGQICGIPAVSGG